VSYRDVPCKTYEEGTPLAITAFTPHKLGVCPVIWYQNTSSDSSPDGDCDYESLYENLDQLDRLSSQVHKGTAANVDPTLVVKEDQMGYRSRKRTINKGQLVRVDTNGDAKYLEMAGTSIQTSQNQLDREKAEILQTANCVILDQSYSGALQSSESMQMLFRSMESQAGIYRKSLASVVEQLAELWCLFAHSYGVGVEKFADFGGGKSTSKMLLPPCMDSEDGDGKTKPHKLGPGGVFRLKFPPLFQPTPAQLAQVSAALSTSTGAKQFLSSKSATRVYSGYLGIDSEEETSRVDDEKEEGLSKMMEIGGSGVPGAPPGSGDEDEGDDGDDPFGQQPTSLKEKASDKPKTAEDVTRPAAKAKSGKRGPAKPR
jgi:hypothetical protein